MLVGPEIPDWVHEEEYYSGAEWKNAVAYPSSHRRYEKAMPRDADD